MMRPSGMTDQANNTLVSGVSYGVANEVLTMNYDGGTENRSYNTMFQLTNITFTNGAPQLNITYNFPAGANNAKIASQSDALSGETVSYQYDSLNRLISASAASWSQTYSYDGFGNLTGRVGTGTAQSTTISTPADAATNRLSGYSYDANGNLLSTGNLYDAENRLRQANMPGGTIQYFYDGQNKRIWQGQFTNSNDPQMLMIENVVMFGADGKLAGSYTPQANWTNTTSQATITFSGSTRVYFAGKLIKSGGGNVVQDRLGTVGKFYPYGEQRDSSEAMFATYTRDVNGLDYADQRFYASAFGRFISPDPYKASAGLTNPQSWNRYAYVEGDPVNASDPSGLYLAPASDGLGPDLSCTALDIFDAIWCGGFIRPLPVSLTPIPALTKIEARTEILDEAVYSDLILDWQWANGFDSVSITLDSSCPPISGICKAIDIGYKLTIAVAVLGKALATIQQRYDDDKNDCNKLKYPGDPDEELKKDPSQRTSPGDGWEWRGPSDLGQWYNPSTGESLRPHPADATHDSHWDYIGKNGNKFRKDKDGCNPKVPQPLP